MSVWEENFGRKTEGKGAGSRSAWRFDLLWIIFWEIVCCASVPQPHLNKFSPAATGLEFVLSVRLAFKAAVHKFLLFVAISVWKPGIAALCGIIFRVWGCDPVF